jgi:hypothetical protein
MGLSLAELLAQAKEGFRVETTIASNQDNGIVGYTTGRMTFHEAEGGTTVDGPPYRPPNLTSRTGAWKLYFSNRGIVEGAAEQTGQPFKRDATDELLVEFPSLGGASVMKLTFVTWGGGEFSVPLEPRGKPLIGLGPSLGGRPRPCTWWRSMVPQRGSSS